jgi:uncharacterized protein
MYYPRIKRTGLTFSLPASLFIVTLSFVNNFNTLAPAGYAQCRSMPNKLIHESSPYLLQHANNPVNWYPWGDEALGLARTENKMIFLSIGYSSCHWCHVMERESFEDEHTAAFLNEHFICIKVDREERPDIDAVYMEAVQIMGQQGGWPLNVWLTPALDPIFGGTYFPVKPIHGRPSFMDVLKRLLQIYDPDNPEVNDRISQIRTALGQDLYSHVETSVLSDELFMKAAGVLADSYDVIDGGFSPAPKFPMAMCIRFLIRLGAAIPGRERSDMALNTLRKMIGGGIYDQIGGGFHRYSTDTRWLVPHFEKMLYDQALILAALADAGSFSGDPLFERTVHETVNFLTREMKHEAGAYFSALDADTEGVEGRFYIWNWDELTGVLTPDELEYARLYLGASPDGNWDGVNILTGSASGAGSGKASPGTHGKPGVSNTSGIAETTKSKLLAKRNERVRPGLDDKVITSWNAMLLKSLCLVARAFNNDDWRENAIQLARFLSSEMRGEDIVYRIWKNGKASQPGFLDDYALLAEAYTYIFELTGDESWLHHSGRLCRTILESFYDEENNAFFYTSPSHDKLPVRTRNIFDNAEPSGTSAAIAALWRNGMLTGNSDFTSIATIAAERLVQIASKHATAFGYLLDAAIGMHYHKEEIVIAGINGTKTDISDNSDNSGKLNNADKSVIPDKKMVTGTRRIRKIVARKYLPFSLIVEGGTFEHSRYSTLAGKTPVGDKPTIYVCKDFSCLKPVHDASVIGQ